jgi:hypothetical protein
METIMTYKRTAGGLALSLCLVLAIGQAQDQPLTAQERRAAQIERIEREQAAARAERDARCVEALRQMQGAWQLVEYRSAVLHDAGRQEVGFVLVSGEFLSIEIHMAYFGQTGEELQSFIQTGTYRLNFTPRSDLTAMLLIGTNKSPEGYTIPTVPGTVKVYDIDFLDGAMVLTSEDSSRFRFEPVATGALTELLYSEVDWLPGEQSRLERSAAEASAQKQVEDGSSPLPDQEPDK